MIVVSAVVFRGTRLEAVLYLQLYLFMPGFGKYSPNADADRIDSGFPRVMPFWRSNAAIVDSNTPKLMKPAMIAPRSWAIMYTADFFHVIPWACGRT